MRHVRSGKLPCVLVLLAQRRRTTIVDGNLTEIKERSYVYMGDSSRGNASGESFPTSAADDVLTYANLDLSSRIGTDRCTSIRERGVVARAREIRK